MQNQPPRAQGTLDAILWSVMRDLPTRENPQLTSPDVERMCSPLWDSLLASLLRHFHLSVDECLDPLVESSTQHEPSRTLVLQFIGDRVLPLWPRLCAMAHVAGWYQGPGPHRPPPTPPDSARHQGPGAYLYRVSRNYVHNIRRQRHPLSTRAYDHTRELMLTYLSRPGAWQTLGAKVRLDAEGRPMTRGPHGDYQAEISKETWLALTRAPKADDLEGRDRRGRDLEDRDHEGCDLEDFDLAAAFEKLGQAWVERSKKLSCGPKAATQALVQLLELLPGQAPPVPSRLSFSMIQDFLHRRYLAVSFRPRVVQMTGREEAPGPIEPLDLRSQMLLHFDPDQHLPLFRALPMETLVRRCCQSQRAERLLQLHQWLVGSAKEPGFLAAQTTAGHWISDSFPTGKEYAEWALSRGHHCGSTQLYGDLELIRQLWFHALELAPEASLRESGVKTQAGEPARGRR